MACLKILAGAFIFMAVVWLLYDHFGHELIRTMYEGTATGFLSKIIEGQAVFPVEYYLKLADKLFFSVIFLIILMCLMMYFIRRLYLVLCRENRTILFGIMLLVTFSLAGSLRLFCLNSVNAIPLMTGVKDWMTVYEQRFSTLKTLLSGAEAIGYVSEKYGWEAAGRNTAKYFRTRYFLSPVIIDTNKRTGLIIGNFDNEQSQENLKKEGLIIVKDFGKGLMLLKKNGAKQ